MIEIFLQGLGVGFAVAAPVGPVGLLCIRRTLVDGPAAGLAAGLGAATADAFYGLMVAAGLAATGLLLRYAEPMTLGGGALIVFLGALSIRAFLRGGDPAADAAPAIPASGRGALPAFAATFVLTLSNPMTILAFLALVAGLGGAAAAQPGAAYLLVLGVFLGSALWWLLLVAVTTIARHRLPSALTRWLDLASGLVLIVWGGWIALGALA